MAGTLLLLAVLFVILAVNTVVVNRVLTGVLVLAFLARDADFERQFVNIVIIEVKEFVGLVLDNLR